MLHARALLGAMGITGLSYHRQFLLLVLLVSLVIHSESLGCSRSFTLDCSSGIKLLLLDFAFHIAGGLGSSSRLHLLLLLCLHCLGTLSAYAEIAAASLNIVGKRHALI